MDQYFYFIYKSTASTSLCLYVLAGMFFIFIKHTQLHLPALREFQRSQLRLKSTRWRLPTRLALSTQIEWET